MFASLMRAVFLLPDQPGSNVTDVDSLAAFWIFLCIACVAIGGFWLLVKFFTSGAKPPRSTRTSSAPASVMPQPRRSHAGAPLAQARALRPLPRRVIRLHAVTPGQSQHEYNVGDQWGTRGSALARVA